MKNKIEQNKKFFNKIARHYDNGITHKWFKGALIKILKIITIKENSRILDLGCGTGNLLKILEEKNKNLKLYGIDISEEMLKIAERRIKDAELKLESAEKIDFKNNYFDYVFSTEAFHHYDDENKVMKNSYKILKKNGYLIIMDLDFGSFLNKIFHLIEPGNTKMHSLRSFKKIFKDNGFIIIKQKRINIFFILTIGKK